MAVRKPAEWMNSTDERLLEYLDSEGSAAPYMMEDSDEIDYSRNYMNKRLVLLRGAELTELIGNGVYRITPKGRAFIAGQEDLRDVENPENDD